MPRPKEKLTEKVFVLLTHSDAQHLDAMAKEGGIASRSVFIRSLLSEIIRDDRAAHERAA